ncbi:MAG: class I tRNA ligase family protein, partial [Patescibacteria group bacterium]|nr:class I tRNA ligase family protein [Patescibacteria group bacterium]
ISDDEIVYKENKTKLYTFKYWKDFPISIATTRPETKLGDTGIAVNPEDIRYKKYIGKEFEGNFAGTNLKIRIVSDSSVDPEFGTGAVGITPAHSMIDYEIGEKNNLPVIQVINEYARISIDNPEFKDKKTTEARDLIIEWIRKENLLENEEEITQNIATAERTGGVVEPLPKLQWFVNVNKPIPERDNKTLKDIMRYAVQSKQINILPEYFDKTYFHWIDNLRDWCISRQIWFGHRIPVWYKGDEVYCGIEAPKENGWEQDEDTLDTWFSSGLWTFSTLGWPEKTKDLELYHPTSVLETGYDILFFWVARMILMSGYLLGTVPFKTIYLHGIVRDEKGRKISKSLDNNADPVDLGKKYGSDAVRLGLIIGTGPGNDSKISENKLKGYKNFANKIWNIARFILSTNENVEYDEKFSEYTDEDKKLIKDQSNLLLEITKEMDEYKFYLVGEKIYHYVWHTFADIIIEDSKNIFAGIDNYAILSRKQLLFHSLGFILKILHPFMPFITEEIWSLSPLNKNKTLLLVEKWPI